MPPVTALTVNTIYLYRREITGEIIGGVSVPWTLKISSGISIGPTGNPVLSSNISIFILMNSRGGRYSVLAYSMHG